MQSYAAFIQEQAEDATIIADAQVIRSNAVNRANVHKVLAKDMSPEWLRQQLSEVVAEIRAARPA